MRHGYDDFNFCYNYPEEENTMFSSYRSFVFSALQVLALTLVLSTAAELNADFIADGDFSSDPTGIWTVDEGETGMYYVPSWDSVNGDPGGNFLLNSNGLSDTDPTISQVVDGLTVGAQYSVKGDYYLDNPYANATGTPDTFGVFVTTGPFVDSKANAILESGLTTQSVWTDFNASFIATSTSETIGFAAELNGSDYSYRVDNLALVAAPSAAVPEPSSLLMLSSGVIGLLAWRRGRCVAGPRGGS